MREFTLTNFLTVIFTRDSKKLLFSLQDTWYREQRQLQKHKKKSKVKQSEGKRAI